MMLVRMTPPVLEVLLAVEEERTVKDWFHTFE
jgi:hypothetical protein